jgi:hypothetical protein
VYIGSCKVLRYRKQKHKTADRSFTKYILENGGWENYYFDVIERNELLGNELKLREKHFINELQPVANKNSPVRTKEEYREYHNERHRVSPVILCECGGHYKLCGKARHIKREIHQTFLNLFMTVG